MLVRTPHRNEMHSLAESEMSKNENYEESFHISGYYLYHSGQIVGLLHNSEIVECLIPQH